MKHRLLCGLLLSSSVGRIFKRGGLGTLRVMWTKRKISPLVITPFISPNYRRRPKRKKWSSLKFSLFFCPKLGKDQKKRSLPTFCPLVRSDFLPKLQRGGGGGMQQFCILFYANYTILATKGEGHGPMPPLNTPLLLRLFCVSFLML